MPRRGGEADKLGNRYEMLCAVQEVLDLLDGESIAVTLEAIGEEESGADLVVDRGHGGLEYHCVKRRQTEGNWTLFRLQAERSSSGRSVLRDLVRKARGGATSVFVSGTSANELEDLAGHAAASDSFQTFKLRLNRNVSLTKKIERYLLPICGDDLSVYRCLKLIRVVTNNDSALVNEIERRIKSLFRTNGGDPIDPEIVRLVIAELLSTNLGNAVGAPIVLQKLAESGHIRLQLTDDVVVGGRIDEINNTFLAGVNALLINSAQIDKCECESAHEYLLGRNRSVLIEGEAGSGKSCVLAQVLAKLTDEKIPCLVISAERVGQEDRTAKSLGKSLGLPASPAISLGEFAGDRRSVLCIDQLDSLSIVSGRRRRARESIAEIVAETHRYPNMQLLIACRDFDLKKDQHLRKMLSPSGQLALIEVQPLDADAIKRAIEAAVKEPAQLSQPQIQILSKPIQLHLFLESSKSGAVDFSSPGELFDAYWDHKSRLIADATGQQQAWAEAVAELCDGLSERESLVAPVYVMDAHHDALDAMASESVVYIESSSIRFFHESFFDYAFARTFLRRNLDLISWLRECQQGFFRRSQVRQILTYLRGMGADQSLYLTILDRLFSLEEIRFHIKKLTLDWLGVLADPSIDEWLVVDSHRKTLGNHIGSAIFGSVPWFDLLHEIGEWESWLGAGNGQVDRIVGLLRAPKLLGARSSVVAQLVRPYLGVSKEWDARLRVLAVSSEACTSRQMQDLVVDLIANGALDRGSRSPAEGDDFWMAWYVDKGLDPQFIARLIGAWFDRRIVIAEAVSDSRSPNAEFRLAAYGDYSDEVVSRCAASTPRRFIQEVLPRFQRVDKKWPQTWNLLPRKHCDPDEQLADALVEAMSVLAISDPNWLDEFFVPPQCVSKWLSTLACRVWSVNPCRYADRTVQFILEHPSERLDLGYSATEIGVDPHGAVTRQAIKAAAPVCSSALFGRLEQSIVDFKPIWEGGSQFAGWTELSLLRVMPAQKLSESTMQRISTLARKFEVVPIESSQGTVGGDVGFHWAEFPIPDGSLAQLANDRWLSGMLEFPDQKPSERHGRLYGGSIDLSRELTCATRMDPARFTDLATHMDALYAPDYFAAILRGLTTGEVELERAGSVVMICSVLRRIELLGLGVSRQEIARAIESMADESIPQDVLRLLRPDRN